MRHEITQTPLPKEDGVVPYCYLLEWEWPEHIELLLRRLIWSHLNSCDSDANPIQQYELDSLTARVAWLIAINPGTNSAILDVLADVECQALAERVAEHQNTCAATLRKLATHQASQVRSAVAENPNTPFEVLKQLAEDDSPDVRYVMAENAATTEEILERLVEDENCYVSHRARQTLNRLHPPKVATLTDWRARSESVSERSVARC